MSTDISRRQFCCSLAAAALPAGEVLARQADVDLLIRRGDVIHEFECFVNEAYIIVRCSSSGKRTFTANIEIEAKVDDINQFTSPRDLAVVQSKRSGTFLVPSDSLFYQCYDNRCRLDLHDAAFSMGDHRHFRYMNHRFENSRDRVQFAKDLMRDDPILGAYFWDRATPLLAGESEFYERKA